jgi:hypothetical protein
LRATAKARRQKKDGHSRDAHHGNQGASADQDQASLDQWPGRAHEPHDQGSDQSNATITIDTIGSKLTLLTSSTPTTALGG